MDPVKKGDKLLKLVKITTYSDQCDFFNKKIKFLTEYKLLILKEKKELLLEKLKDSLESRKDLALIPKVCAVVFKEIADKIDVYQEAELKKLNDGLLKSLWGLCPHFHKNADDKNISSALVSFLQDFDFKRGFEHLQTTKSDEFDFDSCFETIKKRYTDCKVESTCIDFFKTIISECRNKEDNLVENRKRETKAGQKRSTNRNYSDLITDKGTVSENCKSSVSSELGNPNLNAMPSKNMQLKVLGNRSIQQGIEPAQTNAPLVNQDSIVKMKEAVKLLSECIHEVKLEKKDCLADIALIVKKATNSMTQGINLLGQNSVGNLNGIIESIEFNNLRGKYCELMNIAFSLMEDIVRAQTDVSTGSQYTQPSTQSQAPLQPTNQVKKILTQTNRNPLFLQNEETFKYSSQEDCGFSKANKRVKVDEPPSNQLMAKQQSIQQGTNLLPPVPGFWTSLVPAIKQAVAVNSLGKVKEKPDTNEVVQKKKDDNPGQKGNKQREL